MVQGLGDRLEVWLRKEEVEGGGLGRTLGWAAERTGLARWQLWLVGLVLGVLACEALPEWLAFLWLCYDQLWAALAEALAVMEVGSPVRQGKALFRAWALLATFSLLASPGSRYLVVLWLCHPVTDGAALLYHGWLRPFVFLQHRTLHLPAFEGLHWLCSDLLHIPRQLLPNAHLNRLAAKAKKAAHFFHLEPQLRLHNRPDAPVKPDSQEPATPIRAPAEFYKRVSVALSAYHETLRVH